MEETLKGILNSITSKCTNLEGYIKRGLFCLDCSKFYHHYQCELNKDHKGLNEYYDDSEISGAKKVLEWILEKKERRV